MSDKLTSMPTAPQMRDVFRALGVPEVVLSAVTHYAVQVRNVAAQVADKDADRDVLLEKVRKAESEARMLAGCDKRSELSLAGQVAAVAAAPAEQDGQPPRALVGSIAMGDLVWRHVGHVDHVGQELSAAEDGGFMTYQPDEDLMGGGTEPGPEDEAGEEGVYECVVPAEAWNLMAQLREGESVLVFKRLPERAAHVLEFRLVNCGLVHRGKGEGRTQASRLNSEALGPEALLQMAAETNERN